MSETLTYELKGTQHIKEVEYFFRFFFTSFPEYEKYVQCVSSDYRNHPYVPECSQKMYAVHITYSVSSPDELVRFLYNVGIFISYINDTRLFEDMGELEINGDTKIIWHDMTFLNSKLLNWFNRKFPSERMQRLQRWFGNFHRYLISKN